MQGNKLMWVGGQQNTRRADMHTASHGPAHGLGCCFLGLKSLLSILLCLGIIHDALHMLWMLLEAFLRGGILGLLNGASREAFDKECVETAHKEHSTSFVHAPGRP